MNSTGSHGPAPAWQMTKGQCRILSFFLSFFCASWVYQRCSIWEERERTDIEEEKRIDNLKYTLCTSPFSIEIENIILFHSELGATENFS